MPDTWQQRLSGSFAQLLLIHLLREECFVPAAHQYVSQHLGKQFTEPEPWTLDEVFKETSAKAPIIFILTTGKCSDCHSVLASLLLMRLERRIGSARHSQYSC
jgi:hypothetical protein